MDFSQSLQEYIVKNSLKKEFYEIKSSKQIPVHFKGYKLFHQEKYVFNIFNHSLEAMKTLDYDTLDEALEGEMSFEDLLDDDDVEISTIKNIEYTVYVASDIDTNEFFDIVFVKNESCEHGELFSKYKILHSQHQPLIAYQLERDYDAIYSKFLSDFAEKLGEPLLFSRCLNQPSCDFSSIAHTNCQLSQFLR